IFSIIGEELGLRCTLLIVFCYIMIIVCGVLIAMNARDRFGMLLGFGLVVVIALQAAGNIGVHTALLPNKGVPPPQGPASAICQLWRIQPGVLPHVCRDPDQHLSSRAHGERSSACIRPA